jgi:hypothetical protein
MLMLQNRSRLERLARRCRAMKYSPVIGRKVVDILQDFLVKKQGPWIHYDKVRGLFRKIYKLWLDLYKLYGLFHKSLLEKHGSRVNYYNKIT